MIKNIIPFIFVFFVNASYASNEAKDLGGAVSNLAGQLLELNQFVIYYFAPFFGMIMALHFLSEIKKESDAAGQQRASTFGIKPFWGLVLATSLMSLHWTIDIVSASFGLDGGVSCLGSNSSSIDSLNGAIYVVKTVGVIVVIKSLIVFWNISKGASSQHSIRQGLSWLVWGAFAINFEQTIYILSVTLGIENQIYKLLPIAKSCGSGSSLGY